MPESTYIEPILLRGDMIATLAGSPFQQGNPGDANFGMILPGAEAMGANTDLFRLVWYQNVNTTDVEFANGQGWRLESYDPAQDPDGDPTIGADGWATVPGMTLLAPKNDLVSGLGGGDDYIVLDAGGSYLLYDTSGSMPATPTTLTYLAADQNGVAGTGGDEGEMDFFDAYAAVVCFAAGTLIATPDGPRPVETLAPGDLVTTRDGTAKPLVWISLRVLAGDVLKHHPNQRPVRIKAGALGQGLPWRDLLVSPQHRIVLRSPIALRVFGSAEVLAPAIRLTDLPGITQVAANRGVIYHHFMLERHEVVFAEGAPAESFYPGVEAMRAIDPAARRDLFTRFPALAARLPGMTVRTALRFAAGPRARTLIATHKKNHLAPIAG